MNKISQENILFQKYEQNSEHAQEVCKYAIMLFESFRQNLHKYQSLEEIHKTYLEQAAYLHDIGYSVDKKSHHKHSMNIILNEGIEGFSETEALIIANIARYHRNAFPNSQKHENFAALSAANQEYVTLLSGILRLADGLDKPHKNLILRINSQETEHEVNIYFKTIGFKPNLKAAEMKKDLLEFALKKRVNLLFM